MVKNDSMGVQLVKGPSGDAMLLLPVDKKLAATLAKGNVAIAVAKANDLIHLKQCLARYDAFRLRPDEVVKPIARRAR